MFETQDEQPRADGVDVFPATANDLEEYAGASEQLGQMQVPVLVSDKNPNERLFVAVLDGTGNNMDDPEMGERTGVSRIYEQIRDQQNSGQLTNVAAGYIAGTGTTTDNSGADALDAATGHSFEERAETMYRQFIEQAARWKQENPDADIRVAAIGFSRGAEEAAYFTRLVDERGIQDPSGAVYETADNGLVTDVRYTKPPLVPPGEVAQAVVLQDPVVGAMSDPANYDRRLPPSVISALQIRASDETRDQFLDSAHLPLGASDNGRSLRIDVPGAHTDIGDGYTANGFGVRNTNMTSQFLNGLVDNERPLLEMRPEAPLGHSSNVIHASDQHTQNVWGQEINVYTREGFDSDGIRDQRTDLAPQPIWFRPDPVPLLTQREAINETLAGRFEYRPLPIAPIPTWPVETRTEAPQLQPELQSKPTVPFNSLFEQLGNGALNNDRDQMRKASGDFMASQAGSQWNQSVQQYGLDQQAKQNQPVPLPSPVLEIPAPQATEPQHTQPRVPR